MVILKLSLVGVRVRTHMNIRPAHVLVDDYVSQVMDMEMYVGHGAGSTQHEMFLLSLYALRLLCP